MTARPLGPALKAIAVLLLIAGIVGYALWDHALWDGGATHAARKESAERGSAEPPARPARSEAPKPEVAATPSEQSSDRTQAEPALMATLRQLITKDPESALRLAREANQRFPNSPDAAERAWIIVKSLDNLKRFHEGQAEARVMVERYRGTSWAADAERHTLVYPLDQPSREEMQAREREQSEPHR